MISDKSYEEEATQVRIEPRDEELAKYRNVSSVLPSYDVGAWLGKEQPDTYVYVYEHGVDREVDAVTDEYGVISEEAQYRLGTGIVCSSSLTASPRTWFFKLSPSRRTMEVEMPHITAMTSYDYRTRLKEFESKYEMSSREFYEKWTRGKVTETFETFEWAHLYREALRQGFI